MIIEPRVAALVLAACAIVSPLAACSAKPPDRGDEAFAAWARTQARESVPHDGDARAAIPILHVQSLRASQAYFRDKLGFRVLWEDGDPADFGAVGRGDAVYFMCQRCQSAPGGWSFVFVKDVDKLYDELKTRGATIKSKPETMPWKLREMQVTDLDGNVIRFAGETEHHD